MVQWRYISAKQCPPDTVDSIELCGDTTMELEQQRDKISFLATLVNTVNGHECNKENKQMFGPFLPLELILRGLRKIALVHGW